MKKALIVTGGWKGHEPYKAGQIFNEFLISAGYDTNISTNLDVYLNIEELKSMNLIVPVWTMGEISKNQEKNLLQAVASGVGIAGWHGCMGDSFRQSTDYQFMIGGQWVAHPGGIINYDVKITNTTDQITKGISNFSISTEQYYMHIDPSNEVLATTQFKGDQIISDIAPYKCEWISGNVMPVVWKRKWGQGNVFYNSIGHKLSDFDVPEVLEIIKRGMLWASK
jgi:type 1 glutamine amidotransferase|tara:strand:- start:2956 stop:3627 length:672 start_codon:yes stop_codon:yes gene_type:complete